MEGKNKRKTSGREEPSGKTALKRISEGFFKLWDLIDDVRMKHWEAKRKRERLRKTLPAEQFKSYRRKECISALLRGMKIAGGLLACVLAVWGILHLIFTGGRYAVMLGVRQVMSRVLEAEDQPTVYPEQEITLGSTGCMLLHSPFLSSYIDSQGNYDFSSIFKYITPYYSEPDYMTCEFEGALGGEELGYHGYPTFISPDVIIENIRDSGVDLQMLATNHIYDGGTYGFHRTLEIYQEKEIACTGARQTKGRKPYYIAEIQGIPVGFLDYVYETEGTGVNVNGIPLAQEDEELLNTFDYKELDSFYQEVKKSITEMKVQGVRFIVMNLHWGQEYQLTESQEQREIAQQLCDLGVDALIGGHPHCEQPIDIFHSEEGEHSMFCIFSVGNALSNQRTYLMDEMPTGHTEDGVLVTLTLYQDQEGTVSIRDVNLLPTWVYRYQEDGSKYYILPLEDVDSLEEETGLEGIEEEARASYERTMEVLGEGLEKAREEYK